MQFNAGLMIGFKQKIIFCNNSGIILHTASRLFSLKLDIYFTQFTLFIWNLGKGSVVWISFWLVKIFVSVTYILLGATNAPKRVYIQLINFNVFLLKIYATAKRALT